MKWTLCVACVFAFVFATVLAEASLVTDAEVQELIDQVENDLKTNNLNCSNYKDFCNDSINNLYEASKTLCLRAYKAYFCDNARDAELRKVLEEWSTEFLSDSN